MRSKNPRYYSYSRKKQLYEVRKTIKGVFHSFGYYHTEMEAQFIVEGLKKADWNPDKLTDEYKEFWITKNTPDPLKHIYRNKYDWSIDKRINGEFIHFYSCKSLIQCLMVRDLLVANDWDMSVVPVTETSTNELYIYPVTNGTGYWIAKNINGKQVYFNFFKTLEQAKKERDLLVANDWDIELVCENTVDIEEDGEMWLKGKLARSNWIYRQPNGRIDYDSSIF